MKRPHFSRWMLIPLILLLVFALIIGLVGIRIIPTGYKGINLQWGEVKGTTGAGLRWVNVLLGQDIVTMNLQIQLLETEYQSTASSDLQEVSTKVAVNYRVQAAYVIEIWSDLRNDYEDRVIYPNVQDALKASTSQYLASEMITKREAVKITFATLLQEKVAPYHIDIISVAMTDFQFSEEFSAAIEAKVTAEQKAQEAMNKLKQIKYEAQARVIEAEAQYNATVTLALADAKARVIYAEAEASALILQKTAEAEAIELVTSKLTDAYIEYLLLMQWDGELPIYWGSDAPLPFLYVP